MSDVVDLEKYKKARGDAIPCSMCKNADYALSQIQQIFMEIQMWLRELVREIRKRK
jgi:hypothetical protein